MICDATLDSHICKMIIRLENEENDNLGRFFAKGLHALLADDHFLLLYVPKDGAKKMQIIRPSRNSYHRERIIKKINGAKGIPSAYYALSHLWGLKKRHLWRHLNNHRYRWQDISNYVYDEKGKPVDPVSMRPEKRDTLLALLKDHPDTYWWIDVLCARTDTPLDIMGDIYSYCLECVVMIDCKPRLIQQLNKMLPGITDLPNVHGAPYTGQHGRELDTLRDYMEHHQERHARLIRVLSKLMKSQWWKRVWTWQEMALPFGNVRLMAETGTRQALSNTITLDNLLSFRNEVRTMTTVSHYIIHRHDEFPSPEDIVSSWFFEILQARISNNHRLGKKNAQQFFYLVDSLGYSDRRCMDPVDYVYGVLGMLQFKIPRMDDPIAIWQSFLSKLNDYMEATGIKDQKLIDGRRIIGINEYAYQVDLRKAKDMSDVYFDLLILAWDNHYQW